MPSGGSGDGAGGSRGGPGAARGPLIHVNTRCDVARRVRGEVRRPRLRGGAGAPRLGRAADRHRGAIRDPPQGSIGGDARPLSGDRAPGRRPSAPPGGGPRPMLLRVLLLDMEEGSASVHRRLLARRRAAVPVAIPAAPSEPTVVSAPRPEVTAPPPLRATPPPPVSGRAATMIGMSPLGRAGVSPPAGARRGDAPRPRPRRREPRRGAIHPAGQPAQRAGRDRPGVVHRQHAVGVGRRGRDAGTGRGRRP